MRRFLTRVRNGGEQGGGTVPLAANFVATSSQRLSILDGVQVGLNPGTLDFSFAFWVNPIILALPMYHISKGATASLSAAKATGYNCGLNTNGSLQVLMSDNLNATRLSFISAPGVITSGTWNHVCCSFTRTGNMVLYVNNVVKGTLAISTRAGAMTSTAAFAVGALSSDLGVFNTFMNGKIDATGFWLRALSAADATELYNNGAGVAFRNLSNALLNGLISYWDYNNNSLDSYVVGNNLTNTNGVTYVMGRI